MAHRVTVNLWQNSVIAFMLTVFKLKQFNDNYFEAS
jgi:hypothetical protein